MWPIAPSTVDARQRGMGGGPARDSVVSHVRRPRAAVAASRPRQENAVVGESRNPPAFSHPDCTVGPGASPGHATAVAGRRSRAVPPIGNWRLPPPHPAPKAVIPVEHPPRPASAAKAWCASSLHYTTTTQGVEEWATCCASHRVRMSLIRCRSPSLRYTDLIEQRILHVGAVACVASPVSGSPGLVRVTAAAS